MGAGAHPYGQRGRSGKESWLLIKHKDDAAQPGAKVDVVDALPDSVVSGRAIEEIGPSFHRKAAAAAKKAPAKAKGARRTDPALPEAAASAVSAAALKALPGARASALPATLAPQLATLVPAAPEGPEWLHEIKYDGYRALCRLQKGKARLFTRQGNDWTDKFGSIGEAAARLPIKEAWLDGEVVALGPDGLTSFGALQEALGSGGKADALLYYAFDVPFLDGFDLTRVALRERKRVLSTLLHVEFGQVGDGRLRYCDHVEGRGSRLLEQAGRHGLEGIVSKRADEPLPAGAAGQGLAQGQVPADPRVRGRPGSPNPRAPGPLRRARSGRLRGERPAASSWGGSAPASTEKTLAEMQRA